MLGSFLKGTEPFELDSEPFAQDLKLVFVPLKEA